MTVARIASLPSVILSSSKDQTRNAQAQDKTAPRNPHPSIPQKNPVNLVHLVIP
jgi:hypothetical protein